MNVVRKDFMAGQFLLCAARRLTPSHAAKNTKYVPEIRHEIILHCFCKEITDCNSSRAGAMVYGAVVFIVNDVESAPSARD